MELSLKKFHIGKDVTQNGYFPSHGILKFRAQIKRSFGAKDVYLKVNGDEFYEGFKSISCPMKWVSLEGDRDLYEAGIDLSNLEKGLYFINISCNGEDYFNKFDYRRQMLIFDEGEHLSQPFNGIIYHIFVDRFYKSGKSKIRDSFILNENWETGTPQFAPHPGDFLSNNMVFGGDLYGIGEKMGYIASLGAKYIYLSPVFESSSNHKYDTGDYLSIDEAFGGEDGLKFLIEKADEKGIKLIFDGVFNHTGADSIYFNKKGNYGEGGAFKDKNSPFYEWYNFYEYPNKYECWWNIETLPRVNSENESYQEFIFNEVVPKWMKLGIGGWRLDVADELSDEFLQNFKKAVKGINKDALIIGEVWENASNKIAYGKRKKYFSHGELDGVMNYPLREAIITLIKDGDINRFISIMKEQTFHYPLHVQKCLMNSLSTHDTERLITVLAGKDVDRNDNELLSKTFLTEEEFKKGIEKVKLAYTLLYFMPGLPTVFYGDEIGMEGYHDPFCRRPFKWERVGKSELLNYFKKLGKIRNKVTSLREGELSFDFYNEKLLVLSRITEGERAVFIYNLGEKDHSFSLPPLAKSLLTGKKITSAVVKSKKYELLLLSSDGNKPTNLVYNTK